MHQTEALTTLSALAQATRLKVLVILTGLADPGMASSDIADAVGVPRHLMSAHLAVLSKAGLVDTLKTGRTVTYTVRRNVLRELADYLAGMADSPGTSS
ncbi:ArsR/SmtB family transcription factor [Sphingomonas pseudosanguinis]|uniref:Putative transcriptional regulator n=1 Tax=Sphingomonas pseudosanguinis TaxID=413712 RepID=A0A7W6ABN3_9SPHN|nr:metalloregulator ArsR/SmtB family transcription factor [Sphingomonas pseudosanguinis]MBB3877781.1 putative transcriptional regulator [Sphingomonas pseudosanguinis]MBN3537657.1 winged helix-turn-helix transcriptional regulator [Sphingomonas pseudosanguinis]